MLFEKQRRSRHRGKGGKVSFVRFYRYKTRQYFIFDITAYVKRGNLEGRFSHNGRNTLFAYRVLLPKRFNVVNMDRDIFGGKKFSHRISIHIYAPNKKSS
jgi:hypothetical protein